MRILITGAAGFIGSNLVKAVFGQMPEAVVLGIDNMNDYYDVLRSLRHRQSRQLRRSQEVFGMYDNRQYIAR